MGTTGRDAPRRKAARRRQARVLLAAVLAIAALVALAFSAHGDRSTSPHRDRSLAGLRSRPSRSHRNIIVGSIRALDAAGMTVTDEQNRFVNVLTDAHTTVTKSQPARSTDIVAGEHVVVVGALVGADVAAHGIIDEGTAGSSPLPSARALEIDEQTNCSIVTGTARVAANTLSIVTSSGTRVAVTTSPATKTTRETKQNISDLAQGAHVEVFGSPDPNYSNVTLAAYIRVGRANTYGSCGA